MKKLLFVIFILQSICSFGQPQGFQENRSGLGVANKNMLSDTEAYFFTNGRTSKRTSRAFNAAKSITKKDNIAPILEKSFNIEVPQEGNYYFLANVLSTYLSDGTFQEISVYVNGKYQGKLDCKKASWEITDIKGVPMVFCEKGNNTICFSSASPFYPEIDVVQLAKDSRQLKKTIEPSFTTLQNKQIRRLEQISTQADKSKSAWEVTPENIEIKDNNKVTAWKNVPVTYTYHRKISVQTTERIILHTTPVEGEDYNDVDTYMYFYNIDNPNKYSWSNDNYDGLQSRLDVTVPAGDYYLVICSKYNSYASMEIPRAGLVNVYYNGTILNEKVSVAGFMIDAPVNFSEALNYFTSKTNASVRLFLLDGNKMLFNSEPYTYYSPADYQWLEGARKKIQHRRTNSNWKVLVSSTSAWWITWGHCDVYCGFKDAPSKYLSKFPNLKSGDAVLMAEDNVKYNSAAWAGGITDRNIWIGNSAYGSPSVWKTWDDYFANKPYRYNNAETYKRDVVGPMVVMVYSKDSTMTGISHFAVTNYANQLLHGYAFESKIGTWGRITHERNSLNGNEFGKPFIYYYKEIPLPYRYMANTAQGTLLQSIQSRYTLKESIKDGLTRELQVTLDDNQKALIRKRLSQDSKGYQTFDRLFEEWSNYVNEYDSNQDAVSVEKILDNPAGEELVRYSKKHLQESICYLANLLFSQLDNNELVHDKELLSFLFCRIAAEKYGSIIEKIKVEWANSSYTSDGAYIYPSCEYFTKKYIKEILEQNHKNISEDDLSSDLEDNNNLFTLTQAIVNEEGTDIILQVPTGKTFSLSVAGVNMNWQTTIVKSKLADAQKFTYHIDANRLPKGMSVCILEIDGKIYSRKIVKK